MGQGQKSNQILVRGATPAMNQFKYEVAREVGVNPPADDYWGNLSSRDCGHVGGQMVKRMIALAEQSLSGGGTTALAQANIGGGTAGGGTFAGGGTTRPAGR